jgi:hypothetical protein
MKASMGSRIWSCMRTTLTKRALAGAMAFLLVPTVARVAAADTENAEPGVSGNGRESVAKLTAFASAGYLGTSGASGAGLGAGVRLALGARFALGLDFGYGLLATRTTAQDRWWLIPSMAVVFPARIVGQRASFDVGAGLGWGTASGYAGWNDYFARPLTAAWAYQLVPTVRAHAIAAVAVSPSVDVFVRVDAAALVMPEGAAASVTDTTWILSSMGARFWLL